MLLAVAQPRLSQRPLRFCRTGCCASDFFCRFGLYRFFLDVAGMFLNLCQVDSGWHAISNVTAFA